MTRSIKEGPLTVRGLLAYIQVLKDNGFVTNDSRMSISATGKWDASTENINIENIKEDREVDIMMISLHDPIDWHKELTTEK